MKIAFVTSKSLSRHATIKRAWGMAPHLISWGWTVTIVAEECAENRDTAAGIAGLRFEAYPGGLSTLKERNAKEEALRRVGADLTHICGLGWRNAIRPSRVPGKLIMDHVELESAIPNTSPLRRWLQRRLEAWSFQRYHGTIAASRYLEFHIIQRLLNRSIRRPILWLPFAYDPSAAYQDEKSVRARQVASAGRKTIAYMGGLYANYGVRDLIAAYRLSPLLCQRARLIFVGRGPEVDYIRQNSTKDPSGPWIEYEGFLSESDLWTFLFASDVLVSPLRDTVQDWARCPSKIYMYMAARKPIVTVAVGENREALGELAFTYRPGEVESLSSALVRAVLADEPISYDLPAHTWETRTRQFVRWVEEEWAPQTSGSPALAPASHG